MIAENRGDCLSVLLHVCCAPDATVAIERLRQEKELLAFFFNPNIHPEKEYEKRLDAFRHLASAWDIRWMEERGDTSEWFRLVRGRERDPEKGPRCAICMEMRLRKSALVARDMGIPAFSTCLTTSPKKDALMVKAIGEKVAAETGVFFLFENFKKVEGFKRSVSLSKEMGLYRQNYCGCIFSMKGLPEEKSSTLEKEAIHG